jgi:predicted SAM-dependent methyltransferase
MMLKGDRRTAGERIRLHIGAGTAILKGWINVDNQPYPGVDKVLDVTKGLPFADVAYVFAEHFIEHLEYDQGLRFLRECRRIMTDDGVLRISTPNLDWVWVTQYHYGQWTAESEAVRDCFWLNKGFRAWGHKFLYNIQTLTETLREAGFAHVERTSYGESRHDALRGLEKHEQYLDSPELSHIIVVEASGTNREKSEILQEPLADYRSVIGVV